MFGLRRTLNQYNGKWTGKRERKKNVHNVDGRRASITLQLIKIRFKINGRKKRAGTGTTNVYTSNATKLQKRFISLMFFHSIVQTIIYLLGTPDVESARMGDIVNEQSQCCGTSTKLAIRMIRMTNGTSENGEKKKDANVGDRRMEMMGEMQSHAVRASCSTNADSQHLDE